MKVVKPITAAKMIGTFLQAELVSSRYAEGSRKALRMLEFPVELITHPDYASVVQIRRRY